MSEHLRDVLAALVDREARATKAPTDLEHEVAQVRRVVARRRAVRATVVSALTATVVLGVAAGAMSLASRAPEVPPALPSTDAPPTTPTSTPTTSPTPSATQVPSATPTETTGSTPDAAEPSAPESALPFSVVQLAAGTDGVTIADRLRLRSQPQVGAASTELGYLPTGTTFRVVEGPVQGSGYWWYRITDLPASAGVVAQQGWVAASDLDGTPWIAAAPSSTCPDAGFDVSEPTATSLAELKAGVTGTWVGCVITPWVSPYEVTFTFRADGTYSSTALSMPDGIVEPALYYGLDGDAPGKTYALKDLLDDSTGVGQIDVVFDVGTVVRGDLRNVRLMGDRLEFEFFHRSTYGPLVYQLTRTGPATTG
ncbi:MAG: hypothetical protein KQH57_13295 [Actinomycetales bacterium]|nr:hypothetical protein [Actinomycetales bacterium]